MTPILFLLLGVLIGAAIGYLFARSRTAAPAPDNAALKDSFAALSAEVLAKIPRAFYNSLEPSSRRKSRLRK